MQVIERISLWPLVITWTTGTGPSCSGILDLLVPDATDRAVHFGRLQVQLSNAQVISGLPPFLPSVECRQELFFLPLPEYFHQVLDQSPSVPGIERHFSSYLGDSWPTKKWFGVNTGSSRGSVPSYVRGLAFIRPSTSLKTVCSSSSFSPGFPTVAFRVFLATLISDSNTPPKCEPSGGFEFHLISLFAASSVILSRSIH